MFSTLVVILTSRTERQIHRKHCFGESKAPQTCPSHVEFIHKSERKWLNRSQNIQETSTPSQGEAWRNWPSPQPLALLSFLYNKPTPPQRVKCQWKLKELMSLFLLMGGGEWKGFIPKWDEPDRWLSQKTLISTTCEEAKEQRSSLLSAVMNRCAL